ncbi:MAG: BrnA antitoxin family protein [Polaromonas sp.]
MPKLKAGTIVPAPAEDADIHTAAMSDPDAVILTDAQWEQVKPLVRRGRPLGSGTKTQVTLRLDVEVVEKFRATGDGWQTRINEALKSWVKRHA